ncbi:MAG: RNB domain-containing ribonuclease [Treponema sp.]|jgi:exoribonuclease-2|nr:RNB domain-containing ribonuclease [Treponema sp.]
MIPLNSLAVYKGRPAVVTETGEKITITAGKPEDPDKAGTSGKAETINKTETLRVREKDIEVLHPGPLRSLADLSAGTSAEAAGTGSGMAEDVRGAWELIESGGVPVPLHELAELAYGSFTPRTAWAAWLLLTEGLYFTGTIAAVTARSAAELEAAEEKRRGRLRESRDREAFLDRLKQALRKGGLDPALDGHFLQDVEALAFGQTAKSRTMKELGRAETPQEAHRLLLECGYWDRGMNPHPRRVGVLPGTSQVALPPIGTVEKADETLPRRDLTFLPAFAIDSPWSVDPDDAVSLETEGDLRVLYVHIADPASAIEPDSPADREARSRGATLYLPEGAWHMLPEEALSRFALGLSPVSSALTFKLTLDKDGLIQDTLVFPSRVRVTRLSYEEADRLAEESAAGESRGDVTDGDVTEDRGKSVPAGTILRGLFSLAGANLERRLNAGAVNIELPEVHLAVQDHAGGSGPPRVTIEPVRAYKSAAMIRECMLLAGEGAAGWASRRQLPFPYIVQETGDLPAKPLPGLAGSCQLRRCMRPRSVSARPGCHWALGLEGYTQVTSPLRRYTDLLAHEQIRAYLRKEAGADGQPLDEEELLFRLAAGDAAAQAVTQAERFSKAHWLAVYLEDRLAADKNSPPPQDAPRGERTGEGPVWDAVVIDKRGNGSGIIIPELALETQIGFAGSPNDTIRVRLKSVRIPEAEVIFVPEKD